MNKPHKPTKEEKIIRLLYYLKQYTDQDNHASIPMIERHFESLGHKNFFGGKKTRGDMIKQMVLAMNTDIDGNLLPKDEWRVVYDDFEKINIEEREPLKNHHIVNLYYRKEFEDRDVIRLIASVRNNQDLSLEDIETLEGKIRKYLTNNNYRKRPMSPKERTDEARRKRKADALCSYYASRKASYLD